MTKIKENIVEKYFAKKFPLDSLKDNSRGSFVFSNANEQLEFIKIFKEKINLCNNFKIIQLKNMFLENGLTLEEIDQKKYA